jgi:hypothetical protein
MTTTEILAEIALFTAARNAALTSQSYSIAGRTYTRADLEYLDKRLTDLRAEYSIALAKEGGKVYNKTIPVFINQR